MSHFVIDRADPNDDNLIGLLRLDDVEHAVAVVFNRAELVLEREA